MLAPPYVESQKGKARGYEPWPFHSIGQFSLFDLKGNLSEIPVICHILAGFAGNHLAEGTCDQDVTGFSLVSLLHDTIDQPQGSFPLIAQSLHPLALVKDLPV